MAFGYREHSLNQRRKPVKAHDREDDKAGKTIDQDRVKRLGKRASAPVQQPNAHAVAAYCRRQRLIEELADEIEAEQIPVGEGTAHGLQHDTPSRIGQRDSGVENHQARHGR